uniref:Uncharacterized protein n=1 Tax=Arundo donax TaxID=35708 RepID=A0A0A9CAF3_ARUDO
MRESCGCTAAEAEMVTAVDHDEDSSSASRSSGRCWRTATSPTRCRAAPHPWSPFATPSCAALCSAARDSDWGTARGRRAQPKSARPFLPILLPPTSRS